MNKKLIKVCGLKDWDNLREVSSLPITHIGLIFYPPSPRFVADNLVGSAVKELQHLKKTGVFVNADRDEIMHQVETYGLDVVQLHGEETPEFCKELTQHVEVMKAFNIRTKKDILQSDKYDNTCDYYLFDAAGKEYGGNGVVFNWHLLSHYQGKTPFFLSGGIGLEEVQNLVDFSHPQWVGIDVNSKFETAPGYKNTRQLKQFIQELEWN